MFTSFSDAPPQVILCAADGNELVADYYSGHNGNFRLEYDLKAGETYIIKVRWLYDGNSGNMNLLFAPIN